MKKKFIAMSLAVVLSLSMSFTALANDNISKKTPDVTDSDDSDSEDSDTEESDDSASSSTNTTADTETADTQGATIADAAPGGRIATNTVSIAVANPDGTVSAVSLTNVISDVQNTLKASVAAAAETAAPQQAAVTVQALMTTAPTEFFVRTVEALAEIKGSEMVVNDCGTVKTAAVAADPLGNNIASAGVIPNVTTGALVMLMSVNADGTVEYVEGVVDPVTGAVLGAFKGVPVTLTVLVLA